MTQPITSTELSGRVSRSSARNVLVSDGIKSIYVNWQGRPLNIPGGIPSVSCSSSGPLVRSVLTGREESISAIARAEIGNPNYAVKFSPMPKGQARLELTRANPEQAEAQAATPQPIPPQPPRRQHKPKTPKRVPSPDTITATTPLRLSIAAQIAFPDGSVSVSGLRREIGRGNLRVEMIAGKQFTTLADIETMRKKCAVPTKARDSSSENHGGGENPIDGSSSTAMPADVASSARQAHLRQTAQRLRASGQTPKRPSPTISDESTSRNSAAVIRLKSE
jgi:hypothetical protein